MAYYIKLRDKAFGPFNEEKLSQMIATGKVSLETEVSTDKRYWQPLFQFSELAARVPGFSHNQSQSSPPPIPNYLEQAQSPLPNNSPNNGFFKSFFTSIKGLFSSSASNNNIQPPISQSVPGRVQTQYNPPTNQSSERTGGGSAAIVLLFFLIAVLFGIIIFQSIQINRINNNPYSSASSSDSIIKRLAKEAPKSVVKIIAGNGAGSGVVIAHDDKSALILTNRHVISDEIKDPDNPEKNVTVYYNEVLVQILDAKDGDVHSGKAKPATLVATPKLKTVDLALVFVGDNEHRLLSQWKIASMEDVEQGDSVYAIGHPGDFPFTITAGICSAKRNEVTHWEIQHTAPINHGNSGGPLLNSRGEIVGINTKTLLWGNAPSDSALEEFDKGNPFPLLRWTADTYNNLFFSMPADFIFDDSQWKFHEKEEQTKALLEKVLRVSSKGK